MKNKRILSLLLAVMILLSSLPFAGVTALAATSGDFEYELLKDGTAKITKYIGSDSKVEIPSKIDGYTVTVIGSYAFWDYGDLTDLSIGSEVVKINGYAFWGCSGLKNVTLPEKLTTIGESAFDDCLNLTSIKIPKSVTDIDHYAFRNCKRLSSITISGEVSHIGMGVLDKTAYYDNEANWEDGMLYVGKYLISANNDDLYTSTEIKNGTVIIADKAFSVCNNLINVIIPNSVKYIGYRAFYNCKNLRNVVIGTGLKEIGEAAFDFCDNLANVYYRGSKAQWNKILIGESNGKLSGERLHYNYDSNANLATPKIKSLSNTFLGVQIIWGEVKGALSYRVFRKTANSGWVALGDTDTTNVIDISAESGNKYTYTVRCVSSDGKKYLSSYDTAGKSINYIEAPFITQVSNTASGMQIKWEKAKGAAKYRVFYRTENESKWHQAGDTASTSYTWTGAKSGTNYIFTVRCISKDGKAYTSAYDPYGVGLRYVAAPKLKSASVTASGINISWDRVIGTVKYRVFYKTGNSGWVKIADTASTNYTWKGAKGGTKYTFTVRCISDDGKSYTSSFDSKGKTVNLLASPKISSLSSTATGIKISWGKVSGAEKYRVFYKNSNGGWTKIADTASTSFNWTGAKSGTKYTFTVRCISKDGKSFTSTYDSTGKSIQYVAAPKISSVSNTATGVKISWGKVAGAAKYSVFYKAGNSGWTKIANTDATSFTWTKAKSGTTYTFTVRCLSSDGKTYTSAFDGTGKSIKYIAPPKVLSAVKIATGTLVTWEKSAGAAKYRVFYKADGESKWHKAGDTTSTCFTWTKAKSGTKYTFTVRCISSDGKTFTSAYDTKGVSQSTSFTTAKGYQGVVKNGVVYIDGYLIANKTYPLPESYGSGITSATQAAFNKMRDAAAKDGMNLYISSGFRSYSTQKRIYNNYVARDGVKEADTYSARPGYSEHQSGLALDLNTIGNAFNGTPQAIWLEKNCYKYGFILRYPKGKMNETGYVYESWHFRYVGEELAKKLYNNGNWITMEDYFGFTSEYN